MAIRASKRVKTNGTSGTKEMSPAESLEHNENFEIENNEKTPPPPAGINEETSKARPVIIVEDSPADGEKINEESPADNGESESELSDHDYIGRTSWEYSSDDESDKNIDSGKTRNINSGKATNIELVRLQLELERAKAKTAREKRIALALRLKANQGSTMPVKPPVASTTHTISKAGSLDSFPKFAVGSDMNTWLEDFDSASERVSFAKNNRISAAIQKVPAILQNSLRCNFETTLLIQAHGWDLAKESLLARTGSGASSTAEFGLQRRRTN